VPFQIGQIQNAPENPGIAFYLVLFVVAIVLSLGATPLMRRFALKIGVVDAPSARKVHISPVPLLGGLAIYFAFMIALLVLSTWLLPFYVPQVAAILFGATVIGLFGFLDDTWGLSPYVKLGAQIAVAIWLVVTGVKIEVFRIELINIAITLLWVITITNAFNFLDNMDGLSSGIAAIAGAFFFLTAYLSGQWLVALMGAAIAGAAAGFVYHNFGFTAPDEQKKIFMGDSGSLFLGYMLAATAIKLRFSFNSDYITWMVPVLVLGLPLFDISLVTFSRLRRRISPLRGGKDHTSHRLVAMGLSKREAVLVIYLVCGALGVASLIVMGANIRDGYFVGGTVLVLAGWAFLRLEHVPLINTNPKVTTYSKNPQAGDRG
jgi:UDP-GlcNAc:undecaprenyl-phosphate/decaprenyl-phosphate GlcNAc-1-phosphate transferase